MKPPEAMGDTFPVSVVASESQIHFQCEPRPTEPVAADDLLRCRCGALLARWVAAGLELKCRRCKRTTLISVLTPSRLTHMQYEIFPIADRKGRAATHEDLSAMVVAEHGILLPNSLQLRTFERALVQRVESRSLIHS